MASPKSAFSREFIEQQRQRLEALRMQLLGGEQTALARARAFREAHGDEAHEFEDTSQDLVRQEVDQAVHDVDARRLRAIERALRKIDEGTYGLSDHSGEPIPLGRLQSTPEAILTVEEERGRERGADLGA